MILELILLGAAASMFVLALTLRVFRKADKRDKIALAALIHSDKDTERSDRALELSLAAAYVASIPGTDRERRPSGYGKAAIEQDGQNVDDQFARMQVLIQGAKDLAK